MLAKVSILLLQVVDLLVQLLVFGALLCQTESPCLPLMTCHMSRAAKATATSVPAGRPGALRPLERPLAQGSGSGAGAGFSGSGIVVHRV